MASVRQILHIDMNAFYAACHSANDPRQYAHRPIAVAGNPETRHGVIVTASYEARARGVRTTMTVPQALRICPELILIRPDFSLYRSYSRKVFDIVRRFTPLVEIVSIDECYADVTGSRQFGDSVQIANTIQDTILEELKLPCSIGVADCKFFAKMGSNLKKPLGIIYIGQDNFRRVLWPLPVGEMHGVGEQTAKKLWSMNIRTIGQLAACDANRLRTAFGVRGVFLKAMACGQDERAVSNERKPAKSVGHSVTLPEDVATLEALQRILLNLADQVGRRARKHQAVGRSVAITIRYANRNTITRRTTMPYATDLTEHIYQYAKMLLQSNWQMNRPVRLLGVALCDLAAKDTAKTSIQTELFGADDLKAEFTHMQKLKKLTKVTDTLRNRFGEDIIIRGRMLEPDVSNALRNHRTRGTSLQTDQLFEKEE
ncbi:DNA polymerase IV [Alicyclobacillus fodiniaquatilis]|uniref:DNA polymerase IV n=1 Tax=Alicyclobacillus fodiniaquatilis TaxID=1661150 RepID=A0ABW4JNF7_9BACL